MISTSAAERRRLRLTFKPCLSLDPIPRINFRTARSNSSSSHLLIIIYTMYLKQLTGVSNIERIQRNEVH